MGKCQVIMGWLENFGRNMKMPFLEKWGRGRDRDRRRLRRQKWVLRGWGDREKSFEGKVTESRNVRQRISEVRWKYWKVVREREGEEEERKTPKQKRVSVKVKSPPRVNIQCWWEPRKNTERTSYLLPCTEDEPKTVSAVGWAGKQLSSQPPAQPRPPHPTPFRLGLKVSQASAKDKKQSSLLSLPLFCAFSFCFLPLLPLG